MLGLTQKRTTGSLPGTTYRQMFVMKSLVIVLVSALILSIGAIGLGHTNPLPLGDGKISQTPKVGSVFSCRTSFFGGGAHRRGEWIMANTWDPEGKPRVDGQIRWPNSSITVSVEGDKRVVRANNLPKHATGQFPISSSDDAYRYDRNPNSIQEQDIVLMLPAVPVIARVSTCVRMGMIGFALTGVAIYNALDARGRDAPAHEIQDLCNGHPQRTGQYHYHDYSKCITDTRSEAGGHSDLLGFAIDGFGIYGPFGDGGKELHVKDLDECHGHPHQVKWDGKPKAIYHYHFTAEYPYTMGCFRGDLTKVSVRNSANERRGGRPERGLGPRRRAVLRAAAQELGVSVSDLRGAIGPPPPDFANAARVLGIEEAKIRAAMRRARQRMRP